MGALTAWAVAACALAALLGLWAWGVAERVRARRRYQRAVRQETGPRVRERARSPDARVIDYLAALTTRLRSPTCRRWARLVPGGPAWARERVAPAGLSDAVSAEACREAQVRLGAAGCAGGMAVGAAFSSELAVALGLVGAVAGARAPRRAVEARCRARAQEMERHLSEMLDVVALGLRSGLSFDRSLRLYVGHFDTLLSASLASAQRQWESGLVARDEALRQVASTYDSAIFARVVEDVIRSLRFGSSLAEGLEAAAREARGAYRARMEEQVAKAPVKMMVPTAALILPAMLMLVLGPVMLELIGGFS
ncbi:MAG: type II secretion system F family protein [Eggerthellaceae bacterium]|nr:type II secretion system F family protein [Eggerthellaceae bacterium]